MSLAVEAGDEYAKILLGEYYRCGIGVPRNDQKAFELYREMAEQGDDYGQLQVAMYYLRGSGIAKNGAEALMWFYKAAQNGNKEAQSKMDSFCANEISLEIGLGNPKRTEEIESLNNFRKDAEQGDVDTQFLLGLLLLHDVTCKDEDVKWFRRAAENGHAEAQYYMGTFFEHGYKVRPSESLAMEWFRKAAENGHSIAQHNLGFYYEVRMGNDKEAAKWYLMAARQGNIDAMAQALAYHEDGIVPLQMDDETKKWVSKVRKMM